MAEPMSDEKRLSAALNEMIESFEQIAQEPALQQPAKSTTHEPKSAIADLETMISGIAVMCDNYTANLVKCAKCDGTITGSHIDSKGKLYHFKCLGGNLCGKCNKVVDGVTLHAVGRMWHPDCFSCVRCQSILRNTFVQKDKNVFWCTACYQATLLCSHCNTPLSTTYLTVNEKRYHKDCFRCEKCTKQLGEEFYDRDGLFYCAACHCDKCGYCGELVTGQYIKCLDKMYHQNCFKCRSCRQVLTQYFEVANQPYCFACARVLQ